LVNIIGENILVLLFPSLFSDFGERGCRNNMDIFVNIIGEIISGEYFQVFVKRGGRKYYVDFG